MSSRKLMLIDLFGPESSNSSDQESAATNPPPKKGQMKRKFKKHHSGHKSSKKKSKLVLEHKDEDIKMEEVANTDEKDMSTVSSIDGAMRSDGSPNPRALEETAEDNWRITSLQIEWLKEKEKLIAENNNLKSLNETLLEEINRVVRRMESMEKGQIPPKTINLPYHDDKSLDYCKRSDRCHTYHITPACFACGEYVADREKRHNIKNCPNIDTIERCVYPLCIQKTKHAMKACESLHSVCRRCKCRGHMSVICLQYSEGYKQLSYEQYRSQGLFTRVLHPHFLYNYWKRTDD